MNTGLLVAPQKVSDYHFGGISGAVSHPTNVGGQWDDYLPVKEYQYGNMFDTFACVSFSSLNCIEILSSYQTGLPVSLGFSDRFLAKASGTTPNGNYLYKVADTIRNVGLVEEEIWPWDRTVFDRDTFYAEIPQDVLLEANKWLKTHSVAYEWVSPTPDMLMNALEYAPLQITLAYAGGDGIIPKNQGVENHAVTLYGYEEGQYWKVMDHYDKIQKKFAWDYRIYSALKFILKTEKPMSSELYNNTLYQLVESPGGFGISIGEKFFVDDLDKILASWCVRNNGDMRNKVGVLQKAEWDALKKYNLRGEEIL